MATHREKRASEQETTASDLSEQAIALAEQLGRIAGTIEGTAEAWLNKRSLTDQLTRVRDGAAAMLTSLKEGTARGRRPGKATTAARPAPAARQTDPARAPGKRRRKPAPAARGIKKSDQAIPKLKAASQARQRRKSYA